MTAAQSALQTHGQRIAAFSARPLRPSDAPGDAGTATGRAVSPADDTLAEDMVGLLQSKNAFLANLAVFRAGDRMNGALLDAVA